MKILKLTFLLFVGSYCNAQTGEIMYTFHDAGRTKNMSELDNEGTSDDFKKQFAGVMFNMSNSTQKLMFSDKASHYVDITGEQIHDIIEDGELQGKFKKKANLEEYYVNFSSEKYTHKRDIFGKYFIVKEDIMHPSWKLVQVQKEILGYLCMKATMADENGNTTTAWYTMSIPQAIGPNTWGGLPGTILELEEFIGGPTYVATSVDLEVTPEVMVPSDGEKVSLKNFLKIEKRKIKEREKLGNRPLQRIEGF